MSSRDYAVRRKSPPKKKPGAIPPWIWLFAGLCIGLAVAAIAYISRPAEPLPAAARDATPPGEELEAAVPEKVQVPPREKPRFTFYELLPSQELVIRDDEDEAPAPAPSPKKPAKTSSAYMIMVASYRERANAEAQKAQLALLGMESRVEKVTIDNRDTYYRVRIGPEPNLARARQIVSQLGSHGIQGVLVKLK